ncbi:MAG: glycosyltransferase family protein [Candidatus Omnitrophica bacterium]|nr:glycosyltransferase family protein [Candidatus Omnitrophota bacterium]
MKACAIIQSRMGSSRLPGKVLLPLADKPVLEHVIRRVQQAKTIQDVILATTEKDEDTPLVELAIRCGAKVYRGSENDVLDRYYQAAQKFKAKTVVRITADCPVIDPKLIDQIVTQYFQVKVDYCSNTLVETFPNGEDIEVFSSQALEKAWKEARLSSEREHVTPYLKKNKEQFKVISFEGKSNLSDKRWTLDEDKDYRFLQILFDHLYVKNPYFGMDEILKFLKDHPEAEQINAQIIRDEGYLKSLKKDQEVSVRNKRIKA